MHACADIISSVPFFEDAEAGFTTSLVTCLTPQVSLRGDFIVREGEVSREMYFIKSGAVQVLQFLPDMLPSLNNLLCLLRATSRLSEQKWAPAATGAFSTY